MKLLNALKALLDFPLRAANESGSLVTLLCDVADICATGNVKRTGIDQIMAHTGHDPKQNIGRCVRLMVHDVIRSPGKCQSLGRAAGMVWPSG